MAISDGRPARGLTPEEALKRWSDPDAWAAMNEYADARESISTEGGRSPHELRHREYVKRREPLDSALVEKLESAQLVGTTTGDIPDPHHGRFVIHKSLWCELDIDYEMEDAAGGSQVFENLEIAQISAIPRNVTSIPHWVEEELKRLNGDAADIGDTEPFDGIIHDARFRHATVLGQDYTFGDIQANIIRILHDAAGTQNPWRFGKVMLAEAGSASRNINELFSSKKDWRTLIESDGRGYYRLRVRLKPGWTK